MPLLEKSRVTLVSVEGTAHSDHEEPKLLGEKNETRVESTPYVRASSEVLNSMTESPVIVLPTEPSVRFCETAS